MKHDETFFKGATFFEETVTSPFGFQNSFNCKMITLVFDFFKDFLKRNFQEFVKSSETKCVEAR